MNSECSKTLFISNDVNIGAITSTILQVWNPKTQMSCSPSRLLVIGSSYFAGFPGGYVRGFVKGRDASSKDYLFQNFEYLDLKRKHVKLTLQ